MFGAFGGLPEKLLRKMYDDVWICIHCGSDDITRYAYPGIDMIRSNFKEYKGATCNKCNKELPYLDERHYGVEMRERNRRHSEESAMKKVWKKTPLWALDNGKEEE